MSEVIGEGYGDEDEHETEGTAPGEGRLDKPSTTGTHRGWGDPQEGETTKQEPGGSRLARVWRAIRRGS